MGNFRQDGNRRFGGGGGKSFSGDRGNRSRPSMHRATCADCGDDCQVPFKPTGDKPVYCSNCFERQSGGGNDRSIRFGNGGGDRRERRGDSGRRSNFGGNDRQMHDAVCAKCGDNCQVPFRPTASKPVYCSNCFEKTGGSEKRGSNQSNQSNEQLAEINIKLNLIMSALGLSNEKKPKSEKKEDKKKNKKEKVKSEKKNKEVKKEAVKKETKKTEEKKPAKTAKAKPAKTATKKKTVKKVKKAKTDTKKPAKKTVAKKKK